MGSNSQSSLSSMESSKDVTEDTMISLMELADLTGFPIELIRSELFQNSHNVGDQVSLKDLRASMMNFLDATMLNQPE